MWESYSDEEIEEALNKMQNEQKQQYVKIVYQTEPIGEYGIVLELTTLDLDAFKKDKQIKYKTERTKYDLKDFKNNLYDLQRQLQRYAEYYYEREIDRLIILQKQYEIDTTVKWVEPSNANNINNVKQVDCNIVYGNVNNCGTVNCKEIRGNVNNCKVTIRKVGE